MGCRPEAQAGRMVPVLVVVPGDESVLPGEIGHLVMAVPPLFEKFRGYGEKPVCLRFPGEADLAPFNPAVERRATLDGQLVAGQMLGVEREGGLHRFPPKLVCLAGHAVNQVDSDVVKPGYPGSIDGLTAFAPVVTPPEGFQNTVVEGLYPDADPVDAGIAKPSHKKRIDVPGVDLHGDLCARGDREFLADPNEEFRQLPGAQA